MAKDPYYLTGAEIEVIADLVAARLIDLKTHLSRSPITEEELKWAMEYDTISAKLKRMQDFAEGLSVRFIPYVLTEKEQKEEQERKECPVTQAEGDFEQEVFGGEAK